MNSVVEHVLFQFYFIRAAEEPADQGEIFWSLTRAWLISLSGLFELITAAVLKPLVFIQEQFLPYFSLLFIIFNCNFGVLGIFFFDRFQEILAVHIQII